jgi:hypothetical protein
MLVTERLDGEGRGEAREVREDEDEVLRHECGW